MFQSVPCTLVYFPVHMIEMWLCVCVCECMRACVCACVQCTDVIKMAAACGRGCKPVLAYCSLKNKIAIYIEKCSRWKALLRNSPLMDDQMNITELEHREVRYHEERKLGKLGWRIVYHL